MTIELGGSTSLTRIWTGGAEPVAQSTSFVFGGTWEAGDLNTVKVNGRSITVAAGSTTISTILTTLVAALTASTNPEIQRFTWSANTTTLTAVAKEKGIKFTITVTSTEADGSAADAQTIDGAGSSTGTNTVDADGPNFLGTAANWGGTLPVDGDTIVFANSDVDVLYGLEDLSGVTPATIRIDQSFTGKIGLPKYNHLRSVEGQPRYLKMGQASDSGSVPDIDIVIGLGEGLGSQRIYLNTNDARTNLTVLNTNKPIIDQSGTEEYTVVWKGTHASNALIVHKGSVGVATNLNEAATVATVVVGTTGGNDGDSNVRLGPGCTLTTVTLLGGWLKTDAAATTINVMGGRHVHMNGAITTLAIDAGTTVENSDGTITNLKVGNAGHLDLSQNSLAKTVTNAEAYAGAKISDPNGRVTWTNGIDLVRCRLNQIVYVSPIHKTWTPTAI